MRIRSLLIALVASVFANFSFAACFWDENSAQVNGKEVAKIEVGREGAFHIFINGQEFDLVADAATGRTIGVAARSGEFFPITSQALSKTESDQLRARALIQRHDLGAAVSNPRSPLLGCAGFDNVYQLGSFGVWGSGYWMVDSYFWFDVILGPSFLNLWQDRLRQCREALASCLATTKNLVDLALMACGAAAGIRVEAGAACLVATLWLRDRADNDCWGRYASCVVGASGLSPSAERRPASTELTALSLGTPLDPMASRENSA